MSQIVLLALSLSASAQTSPAAEFVGASSESFAGYSTNVHWQCVPGGIFDGTAEACVGGSRFDKYTNVVSGVINTTYGCNMDPHTGSRFLWSYRGPTVLTFDTPVSRFGAWLGNSAAHNGDMEIDFLDIDGNVIDSQSQPVGATCGWTWTGWDSTEPIYGVEIRRSNYGYDDGWYLDDVQINPHCGSSDVDCDSYDDTVDCDDNDPTVYPGAVELCDGIDNDCNDVVDDDADDDDDTYSLCDGDCDDNDPLDFPGAAERCDGVDNDCDGTVPADEADSDGDDVLVCDGDCDDSLATVFPGATETCNDVDDDCDEAVDEDVVDSDGDGTCDSDDPCPLDVDDDSDGDGSCDSDDLCSGDDTSGDPDSDGICSDTDPCPFDVVHDADDDGACASDPATGSTLDCDDGDPDVGPGQTELCNGIDDDCDGSRDGERDLDGDGVLACDGDCDDLDADVQPGADELCNDIDDDCDGELETPRDCNEGSEDEEPVEEEPGGCACESSSTPAGTLWGLVLALVVRRRNSAHSDSSIA